MNGMKTKTKGVKLQPKKYNVPTKIEDDDYIEPIIFVGILGVGIIIAFIVKLILN